MWKAAVHKGCVKDLSTRRQSSPQKIQHWSPVETALNYPCLHSVQKQEHSHGTDKRKGVGMTQLKGTVVALTITMRLKNETQNYLYQLPFPELPLKFAYIL